MNLLLGYRLLQPLGATQRCRRWTTAVVPSYLVSKLGALVDEFVLWGVSKLALTLTRSSRSLLVNRLYECFVSLCRWALDALLLSLSYSLVWSSGQSNAGSNTLSLYYLFCWSFSCYRLWGFRVSSTSRSIGLISIMLVGHLTLISYAN